METPVGEAPPAANPIVPEMLPPGSSVGFTVAVPPTLTVWDTAAVPDSQIFTLIGTVIMLPIILGYFVFVFWTFRAKVSIDEKGGYH